MRASGLLMAAVVIVVATLMPGIAPAQLAPTPAPPPTPAPTRSPTPLPTPIVFRCNCWSPGQAVVWAGNVSAPNFFFARQAATGQCLATLEARNPPPPAIALPTPVFAPGAPLPPLGTPNPCSVCACN